METATRGDVSSARNNDDLCRVCLSSNEDNKYIFALHENLDRENYGLTDLWQQLRLYGGIEVAQNDGFPEKMCIECITKMSVAHSFRAQCQETDRVLRTMCKNYSGRRWTNKDDISAEKKFGEGFKNSKSVKPDGKEPEESPGRELANSDILRLSKYSEEHVALIVDEAQDDKLATDYELCRTRESIVSKKFNVNAQFSDPCSEESEREKSSGSREAKRETVLQKRNSRETRKLIVVEKIKTGAVRKSWKFRDNTRKDYHDDTGDSRLSSGDPREETCAKSRNDTSLSKRETHRSRKLIVFKRMTSMQNLKNHKERQRQYMKKAPCPKQENDGGRNARTKKNYHTDISREVSNTGGNNISEHRCSKCGRSYSSGKTLEIHELAHKCEKFICDQCEQRFGRLNDFLEHAKLHNSKEKLDPACCKICNKKFRKTVTMIRHLNVHKRDNPRAVYSILKEIREQRKRTSVEIPIEFSGDSDNLGNKIAPKLGKFTAELLNDSHNEDDSKTPDEACKFYREHGAPTSIRTASAESTLDEAGLKSHMEKCDRSRIKQNSSAAMNSEPQNTPDDRSAIKLINIWIKEELDSDNEGKGFPCDNCNKSYATKKSLLKHRAKMHENHSGSCCRICGQNCTCSERINENVEKQREKLKTFSCEECDKSFEKEAKLEKHVRIHARAKEQQDANFKRFLCHICSKTFRQNTGLMFHMRTHTGYKPHVCKYCGRGFTSNSNCINHERTHTGDRPFVCHFCSAAFAKSCTLKAHITTHTGEANYHCKTCDKSFRRLKYLKEHRFTHTGEKPYACKICGTAYSHSGSLFVHEKKCKALHSDNPSFSVPQSYCQNPTIAAGDTSLATAPIIGTLQSSHDVASIDNALNTHETKCYVDHVSTINAHCTTGSTGSQIHSSAVNPDLSPAIRSFTIVGQVFHT